MPFKQSVFPSVVFTPDVFVENSHTFPQQSPCSATWDPFFHSSSLPLKQHFDKTQITQAHSLCQVQCEYFLHTDTVFAIPHHFLPVTPTEASVFSSLYCPLCILKLQVFLFLFFVFPTAKAKVTCVVHNRSVIKYCTIIFMTPFKYSALNTEYITLYIQCVSYMHTIVCIIF